MTNDSKNSGNAIYNPERPINAWFLGHLPDVSLLQTSVHAKSFNQNLGQVCFSTLS